MTHHQDCAHSQGIFECKGTLSLAEAAQVLRVSEEFLRNHAAKEGLSPRRWSAKHIYSWHHALVQVAGSL